MGLASNLYLGFTCFSLFYDLFTNNNERNAIWLAVLHIFLKINLVTLSPFLEGN